LLLLRAYFFLFSSPAHLEKFRFIFAETDFSPICRFSQEKKRFAGVGFKTKENIVMFHYYHALP